MTDLPAWLQAFAAIVALGIATWTVRETKAASDKAIREARRDSEVRDDLRARIVAATIIVDLEVLRGNIERVSDALFNRSRPIQRAWNFNDQTREEHRGGRLIDAVADLDVELPAMLKGSLGRLHWLGHPNAQVTLIVVGLVFQVNSLLSKMKQDVKAQGPHNLSGWLDQLEPLLVLLTSSLQQTQVKIEEIHSRSDESNLVMKSPWWTRPPI